MEYVGISSFLFVTWYLTLSIRRDKKLYIPETIRKWVIVIFENERFFNQDVVTGMIKGFGARTVCTLQNGDR
jgi:hypothetical protein